MNGAESLVRTLVDGGVNVCFADGSVHFVKSSVSLQAWWGLGTRNGGEVISSDQYCSDFKKPDRPSSMAVPP